MYIIAIAWVYVVLLMAITETSIIAGAMTFAFYCVLPLTVLLYLMGAPLRKRQHTEKLAALQQKQLDSDSATQETEGH
ncbi:hypothetical protein [Undibacterium sp. RuRC25W]|uniref:hypothetical protein n=1 Tax=Undibacterium sp. RuRC25W TaxID=3413047 RepID=UPI003BEFB818